MKSYPRAERNISFERSRPALFETSSHQLLALGHALLPLKSTKRETDSVIDGRPAAAYCATTSTRFKLTSLISPLSGVQPPFGSDQEKGISSFPNGRLTTHCRRIAVVASVAGGRLERLFFKRSNTPRMRACYPRFPCWSIPTWVIEATGSNSNKFAFR